MEKTYAEKIKKLLKDGEARSQKEIMKELGAIDRGILTGYLRCLTDLGEIESKFLGRTKIYFIKRGGKK